MVDRMGLHSKRRNRPRINNKMCSDRCCGNEDDGEELFFFNNKIIKSSYNKPHIGKCTVW